MHLNNTWWKIKSWVFIIGFIVYSLLSVFLFYITSGGWTSILEGLSGLGIAGVITVFLFAICGIRYIAGVHFIFIHKIFLFIVFISQLSALLFNIGDCGDARGSAGNFIQRFFINTPLACTPELHPIVNDPSVFFIVYGLFLIIFLIACLFCTPRHTAKD
ncbi:MAG: hypothetical protein JWM56_489 [Candidatus Peribacteria bacterium]|nr:hypothetical protein [Candidatus Peribacteria bacterium]